MPEAKKLEPWETKAWVVIEYKFPMTLHGHSTVADTVDFHGFDDEQSAWACYHEIMNKGGSAAFPKKVADLPDPSKVRDLVRSLTCVWCNQTFPDSAYRIEHEKTCAKKK